MKNNTYRFDRYSRDARAAGYVARSAYKLIELQQAYNFMQFGQTLLDIGAAPGSWSQYCAKVVGDLGRVVAVDTAPLKITDSLDNVTTIQGDFFSAPVKQQLASYTFHGVLSDLAPCTTGNKFVDAYYIYERVLTIIEQLPVLLFKNGFALFKLFESQEVAEIRRKMNSMFKTCYTRKPSASRSSSKEIYIMGFKYRMGMRMPSALGAAAR